MDLPRQFPYNPQWRIILFGFAFGGALLLFGKIHWMLFVLGIPFTVFAFMLAVRRLAFPKFLKLEQDSLSIPKGFLRTSIAKISYADIENGWETVRGSASATLHIQVKKHTIEIPSMMLEDMASYVAIRDFVKSRFPQKEKTIQQVEAGKYCFKCSYEGNGEIYNSNGEIIWRFKTLHKRPHYPYGFFRLPDFVIYDKTDKEIFRIKLERKWALAQFMMLENGLSVCTINQRSIFRNKLTLNFANGQKWIFRMPLFTVRFGGLSETGEKIRVGVRTHNIWYVSIDTNVDSPQLVAALAFIHRERLRFN
ncbi:MAG TPA: hypothetical protein VHX90_05640 [Verrucomicrobiae bacterium]|jgi:hypothetical protein|nr:hypothetical protein [Verrucomicrobiae bacterium]